MRQLIVIHVLAFLLVGTVTSFSPVAFHRNRDTTMSLSTRSRRRHQQPQQQQQLLSARNNDDDDNTWLSTSEGENSNNARRNLIINTVALGLLGASGVASYSLFQTNVYTPTDFVRLPRTQFIAALGDPSASEGFIDTSNGGAWGIWSLDPGPRGVWLRGLFRLRFVCFWLCLAGLVYLGF